MPPATAGTGRRGRGAATTAGACLPPRGTAAAAAAAATASAVVAAAEGLGKELRGLLSAPGPARADALLARSSSPGIASTLMRLLLRCLGRHTDVDVLGVPSAAQSVDFTEMEALTIIVRLLGTCVGDMSGDAVSFTMDSVKPTSIGVGGEIIDALCSEEATLAVIALLQDRLPAFESGKDPHLRLELLRALRLQLVIAAPLCIGRAAKSARVWWLESEIGYDSHHSTRRLLVDVVSRALRGVAGIKAHMGHRPRLLATCCLWSLVSASPACCSHAVRQGAATLAADVLRIQIRELGPPVEEVLIASCGLLAALGAGPRLHERKLAELNLENDVATLLQRYSPYRGVVTAAVILAAVVARDADAARRLASNKEALADLAAAWERWPAEIQEAWERTTQPLAAWSTICTMNGGHSQTQKFVAGTQLRQLRQLPPVEKDRMSARVHGFTPRRQLDVAVARVR
eukprot:TRINITY_DN30366_c0_g5_i1.p1 TRINITY_DN30366_c0_g5~~TRINITY_DN30366_c0_g5_i1.p1  ORF type:complete len:460 (+),score=50.71 TRINITY_DN30366_c0_g5_i1:90-1469(+)